MVVGRYRAGRRVVAVVVTGKFDSGKDMISYGYCTAMEVYQLHFNYFDLLLINV
ncbi:hypothetical protein Hanom_Chr03g00219861 [Helianthus anomalus]